MRAGFEIASGADPIEGREGFARRLDRIEGNGVSTVIVEDARSLARDLVVQELGVALVAKPGRLKLWRDERQLQGSRADGVAPEVVIVGALAQILALSQTSILSPVPQQDLIVLAGCVGSQPS